MFFQVVTQSPRTAVCVWMIDAPHTHCVCSNIRNEISDWMRLVGYAHAAVHACCMHQQHTYICA